MIFKNWKAVIWANEDNI